MDVSEFAFNLLLIFFPGIICAYMADMFTDHKERTQFLFVVNSFLLGFASYLIYAAAIYWVAREQFEGIHFLKGLSNGTVNIAVGEILKVCAIAVALAIVIIVVNTHKLHFRLLQWLKITKKFGEEDVWGFLMNSPETEWVTVRDLEKGILYDGWVKAFSQNSKNAELLLVDVSVYRNDNGEFLYNVEAQYLSLDTGRISIEIRSQSEGDT